MLDLSKFMCNMNDYIDDDDNELFTRNTRYFTYTSHCNRYFVHGNNGWLVDWGIKSHQQPRSYAVPSDGLVKHGIEPDNHCTT